MAQSNLLSLSRLLLTEAKWEERKKQTILMDLISDNVHIVESFHYNWIEEKWQAASRIIVFDYIECSMSIAKKIDQTSGFAGVC